MLYGCTFQNIPLTDCLAKTWSYNPTHAVTRVVWAVPRSLATTGGNHYLFSFPAGTKMFQFPALASRIAGWYLFKVPGCPIRKSADQRSFAPTRSLSQLITSFIASESQGIRHVPLLTFCLTDHVWSIYTFSFNFTFFWSHHVKDRLKNPEKHPELISGE